MKKLLILPIVALVFVSSSVAYAASAFVRQDTLGEADAGFTDCAPDLIADCTGYNNWGLLFTDAEDNLFLSDELPATSTLDWAFNIPGVSEDTLYTVNAALCADDTCDENSVTIGEVLAESVMWESAAAAQASSEYAAAKARLPLQTTGRLCQTEYEYSASSTLDRTTELCYDPLKATLFQVGLVVGFLIITAKVANIFT